MKNWELYRVMLLLPVIFVSVMSIPAQTIQWLTLDELAVRQEIFPKKVLINVYKRDSKWCQQMDSLTYRDPTIVNYINNHFYAVMLDADEKKTLVFRGERYKYTNKGRNGYHELVDFLLQGRICYPTTVFLDEKMNVIQPLAGYKDISFFEQVITYISEDYYKKISWGRFQKQYIEILRKKIAGKDRY